LNPDGHKRQAARRSSAGQSEPTDTALWRDGVALFNRRQFFECHERWETLWKRSTGADRLFYQAMIQAAAALLHAAKGNRRGALSLWSKAGEKLDTFGDHFKGVALDRLRAEIGAYVDETATDSPRGTPPRIRKPGPLRQK